MKGLFCDGEEGRHVVVVSSDALLSCNDRLEYIGLLFASYRSFSY